MHRTFNTVQKTIDRFVRGIGIQFALTLNLSTTCCGYMMEKKNVDVFLETRINGATSLFYTPH